MSREDEIRRGMDIKRLIALGADHFYDDAKRFGETACMAFPENGKSQIRNLENIAVSAVKVSDILDYIKKQTAKHDRWRVNDFGQELLRYLESDLEQKASHLFDRLDPFPNEYEQQQIKLKLIFEFIRQLDTHYLYGRGVGNGNNRGTEH